MNNFDKSSTGIDINVWVEYDNDLAQITLDENFERLEDDTFKYIDFGNLDKAIEWEEFTQIHIKGYNQGDNDTVLVDMKQLEEVWGRMPSYDELEKLFTQMFYDSPLYVRAEINEREVYSKFDGTYDEYNKDEFIAEIMKELSDSKLDLKVLKEELEKIVPSEVRYL